MLKSLANIMIAAMLCFSVHSHSSFNPQDTNNIQTLINEFNFLYSDRDYWDEIENSTDMYMRYPAMDSLVDMYIVTESLPSGMNPIASDIYLYRALAMAEKYMFHSSIGLTPEGFKVWANEHSSYPENLAHYELRSAAGIAKLLMLTSPHNTNYNFPSSITSRSRSLAKELYNHVWRKWTRFFAQSYDNHIWDNPATDVVSRSGIIALALLNWSNELSLPSSDFYNYLTDRGPLVLGDKYKRKGHDVYNIYCKVTKATCGKSGFPSTPSGFPSTPSGITDTGHGVDNVGYILAATYDDPLLNKYGAFSGGELRGLYNTVKHVIWNRDSNTPKFYDYVDGYSSQLSYQGSYQGGWAKLSRFDSTLRNIYYEYFQDGGVNCLDDSTKRFGDPISCSNPNTQFNQAQLVASLLRAYIDRED